MVDSYRIHEPGIRYVVLTGHYHQLQLQQWSDVTIMRVPSLMGGTPYGKDQLGLNAPAGQALLEVRHDGMTPVALML